MQLSTIAHFRSATFARVLYPSCRAFGFSCGAAFAGLWWAYQVLLASDTWNPHIESSSEADHVRSKAGRRGRLLDFSVLAKVGTILAEERSEGGCFVVSPVDSRSGALHFYPPAFSIVLKDPVAVLTKEEEIIFSPVLGVAGGGIRPYLTWVSEVRMKSLVKTLSTLKARWACM